MRALRRWLACLATLPVVAQADTLTLVNGDRLSGEIVTLDADTLHFKTAYAATLKIPRADIRQLESDQPVRLRLQDGQEYDGALAAASTPGTVTLRLAPLATDAPLAITQIAAINPPRNPDRTVYSGRAKLGGALARGNTDSSSLHLAGEVIARNPSQQVTLGGELNESEQEGVNTASNWQVGLKVDQFLDKKRYLYVNTAFARDQRADLDLRSTLGVGGGVYLIDTAGEKFSLEGGVTLVEENYAAAADTTFPGARAALRYDRHFFDGRLIAFHTSELLLNLEDTSDALYRARTGIRLPLNGHLALTAQLNVDYDHVPAAGKEETDTVAVLGIEASL